MTMTCEEVERAIPWFLDDELEADLSLEVEAHLGGCDACRQVLEREGTLRLSLRRASSSVSASASLRRSVRESIERERRETRTWTRAWPATAAAAVLVAFIWKGAAGAPSVELEAVAERHARDLPMDVVAADVMQVQNYFNNRLPFVVHLPQLQHGSVGQQMGGRVMHLNDRDAAYVRYEMPRGRLSVFVYEDPDGEFPEVAPLYQFGGRRVMLKQVRGYTVAKWRAQGLTYSVVTDMPEAELSTVMRAGFAQ